MFSISIVHWLFSAKYSHYLPAGPSRSARDLRDVSPFPLAETSEERTSVDPEALRAALPIAQSFRVVAYSSSDESHPDWGDGKNKT